MAAASLSELPRLPSDTLAAMLAYVQGLPASLIEPELPAIEIGQWLAAVLWPKVSGPPRIPDWEVEFCRSRTSDAPGVSVDLCAHNSVELSDELAFRFEVRIAAAVQTPGGAVRWVVDTPSVQQLRLTFAGPRPADSDSLDIPSLRDLRCLQVDLRPAGQRKLEPLPAGHTAHIRFSATFPEGSGNALVTAYSFYPETNRERTAVEDNSAVMWVFRATDPRELVVGPEISNPAGIKPQDQ